MKLLPIQTKLLNVSVLFGVYQISLSF